MACLLLKVLLLMLLSLNKETIFIAALEKVHIIGGKIING